MKMIWMKLQEKRKMMTGGDDDDNQTGAKRAKRELGYHGLGAITKLPGIHNSSPDLSFSPEIHNKSIHFSLNTWDGKKHHTKNMGPSEFRGIGANIYVFTM